MSNVITINSTDCRLSGLSSDVASYLEQNVSPEDRRAVAELIQTTEQALGRASEALARIFLSLEGSEVPHLADEFLAYLRGKGLSRQRLSCIRIAARTRAELQASSRLDSGLVSSLLSLGDDHLQVYSRLTDQTKERAHDIIRTEGRISRQQLRQLQAEPNPATFRVCPEPVQAARKAPSPVEPGVTIPVPDRALCPAASSEPGAVEPAPESASGLVSGSPSLGSGSEPAPAAVAPAVLALQGAPAAPQPVPFFREPPQDLPDLKRQLRSAGFSRYEILVAAVDILFREEINWLDDKVRDRIELLQSTMKRIEAEYKYNPRQPK